MHNDKRSAFADLFFQSGNAHILQKKKAFAMAHKIQYDKSTDERYKKFKYASIAMFIFVIASNNRLHFLCIVQNLWCVVDNVFDMWYINTVSCANCIKCMIHKLYSPG